MKITAILPYFGGKRTIAHRIVEQLGPHRSYWELFSGSMAVLLAKPEVSQETVNDLHGDLMNLARVIRHEHCGPWLYRQLRRCLVHEGLFSEARDMLRYTGSAPDGPMEECAQRAFYFFIASWMSRNGIIGTRGTNNNFSVRYTSNGGIQGTRFASAVDSIPAWRRRLREVTILQRDAFDLLAKIEDQAGTALYVDPPYLPETKGSASYVHDFAPADHARLAEALARFKRARVVISYYESDQLNDLYPHPTWSRRGIFVAKGMAVQGKRGSKKEVVQEVLIVNGELYGEAQLF